MRRGRGVRNEPTTLSKGPVGNRVQRQTARDFTDGIEQRPGYDRGGEGVGGFRAAAIGPWLRTD
jgi:hypothetical protein